MSSRLSMACDLAKAFRSLHTNVYPPITHGMLSSSSVFVKKDGGDYSAYLAGYGLSKVARILLYFRFLIIFLSSTCPMTIPCNLYGGGLPLSCSCGHRTPPFPWIYWSTTCTVLEWYCLALGYYLLLFLTFFRCYMNWYLTVFLTTIWLQTIFFIYSAKID